MLQLWPLDGNNTSSINIKGAVQHHRQPAETTKDGA
jgi:hypothetical protein